MFWVSQWIKSKEFCHGSRASNVVGCKKGITEEKKSQNAEKPDLWRGGGVVLFT